MIILKFTKNQGSTLSLVDTFFEKPQGEDQLTPPPFLPDVLELTQLRLLLSKKNVYICFGLSKFEFKFLAGINNQYEISGLKRQCCPDADAWHFELSSYTRAEDQI